MKSSWCLIVTIILAGCGGVGFGRDADSPDLVISVWTDRAALWEGDDLLIRLTVTNPNNFPVERMLPTRCQFGHRIENHAGHTVAVPPRFCTMAPTRLVLQREEVVVRGFRWVWDRDEVAPGAYVVFAGLGMTGELDAVGPVEILLG